MSTTTAELRNRMACVLRALRSKLSEANRIPCERCGCRQTKYGKEIWDWGYQTEAEIVCAECGNLMNYYAYGYLEFPETRTEQLAQALSDVAWLIGNKARRIKRWLANCVKKK